MVENIGVDKHETQNSASQDDAMIGAVNDVIADLMKNVIGGMQKSEIEKQLGETSQDSSDSNEKVAIQPDMDITALRQVTDALQKFLDNANLMIAQLEGVDNGYDPKDDSFIDGYIATADSILEVAAFSTKDPLTGLSNKYGFDNRLVLEWNRAIREATPLSLLIFSVDGSDLSASENSDEMLKAVSDTLVRTIKRSTDFLARWSDNEFAALLPITGNDGAKIVAERIVAEVNNMAVEGSEKVSVSIGVSDSVPKQNELAADFVRNTQMALSKAKEMGNGAIVFDLVE